VPDHPPEAVHDVASVEDQVSVEVPPLVTDVGFAASDTVGIGAMPPLGWSALGTSGAGHAVNTSASAGASSSVFMHGIGMLIGKSTQRWLTA
jgi:hypothetical protein